jgi:hypothetical protein
MNISDKDLNDFNNKLQEIKVTADEFDQFLSTTPHILRSVRGHAFEVWFDRELRERGSQIDKVGGDDVVDRIYNGITLQLKTPYWNGTKDGELVQYKMHKTHGAERQPLCYYKPEEFADFLVAMHPTNGVYICPKNSIPTRGDISPRLKYPEYISDPLPFDWDSEWLNRYDLLGIEIDEPPMISEHSEQESSLLPKTIAKIGFTDYDIIHSILDDGNFRIWNQLIKGSIREFHFEKYTEENNLKLYPVDRDPALNGRQRQKIDYLLDDNTRIQVKGLTLGMCEGDKLGCETQCSHGRVPTRLYRTDDFDYLAIVIDPDSISEDVANKKGLDRKDYNFVIVPMENLPVHPRSNEWDFPRIKSNYHFNARETTFNNIEVLQRKIGNQ